MKQCNYHRNHGIKILLKNHGKCMYNNNDHFKICIACEQNFKKTINVKKWRKNNVINKKSSTQQHNTNSNIFIDSDNSIDLPLLISVIKHNENINISAIDIKMTRTNNNTIQFHFSSDLHNISMLKTGISNLNDIIKQIYKSN
jgi:hypothetical protein